MSYSENNNNYQSLTEDEKKLIDLDEQGRYDVMEKVLDDLDDDDLMQMFRDQNGWDGRFEFCCGWDMDEFLYVMVEGRKGSDLISFILEVAEAINNYDGPDYENAWWGYFNGYDVEIKDESDMVAEGREDYLADLAEILVDDTHHIDTIPSEVEDILNLWNMEDDGEFDEGAEDW